MEDKALEGVQIVEAVVRVGVAIEEVVEGGSEEAVNGVESSEVLGEGATASI